MSASERAEAQRIVADRKRALEAKDAADDVADTTDVCETVMRAAERATGLSRAQLIEMAAAAETDPAPAVTTRPSRDTLKAAGVPELHLRCVYDAAPVECDALREVREFLGQSGARFLVLLGGVGTRKSGTAAWALTQRAGRFVNANELARLARSSKDDEIETFRAIKSRYGLVVIDDVGSEYDSDWFVTVLNDVTTARDEACRPTIITSNILDPDPFKAKYGERVFDRLKTGFVGIGGKSMRGRR